MAWSNVLKPLSLYMASAGRLLCLVGQIWKEAAQGLLGRVAHTIFDF